MAAISPSLLASYTITDLPYEILRLIPMPYRSWQRLRMTCRTLNARLGDYHVARGIIMIDSDSKILTYQQFNSLLKSCMRGVWTTARSYLMRFRWNLEESCGVNPYILRWESGKLKICSNIQGLSWVIKECEDECPDKTILVQTQWYTITRQSGGSIDPLLSFLHCELPDIARCMRIIRPITTNDINYQHVDKIWGNH